MEKKTKIKKTKALLSVISMTLLLMISLSSCSLLHNHDMVLDSQMDATCATEGYEKYRCQKCGYEYTTTKQKLSEHTWDSAPCGTEHTCTVCGKKEVINHSIDTVSCKCIHCGQAKYTIKVPSTPITLSEYYNGKLQRTVAINDIEINMYHISSEVYVRFLVTKTYDVNGNSSDDMGNFTWKLYNSKGVVVSSGIGYSSAILVGETSENIISFIVPEAWEEYRLEFNNYT